MLIQIYRRFQNSVVQSHMCEILITHYDYQEDDQCTNYKYAFF
jgi:hypothetical protein